MKPYQKLKRIYEYQCVNCSEFLRVLIHIDWTYECPKCGGFVIFYDTYITNQTEKMKLCQKLPQKR